MKILLINPTELQTMFIDLPPFVRHSDSTQRLPPLGLLYIASYLKAHTHHEISVLDPNIENLNYDEIEKKIREYKPDICGITAYTFNFLDTIEIAYRVKKVNQNTLVVIGGPHAFIYPAQTVVLPYIDVVVQGEGEEVMTELVDAISQGKPLENIKGIYFKKHEKIYFTGVRGLIKDLDALPYPARKLLPLKTYKFVTDISKYSTTMISSRGCKYKCIFCDVPFHSIRARSPENVVGEMSECAEMGYKDINFYDDNFNFSEERVENICKEIMNRNIKIQFSIRARVDKINTKMLNFLYHAGCRRINFGIESGDDPTLKYLKKGITIDMVRRAVKLTKDAGIQVGAYFILAIPNQPKEVSLRTIDFAIALDPDYAQFMYMVLLPGTELYKNCLENGDINDFYLNFAKQPIATNYKAYFNKVIPFEEAKDLVKLAYRRFYLRPTYILRQMQNIHSLTELIRKSLAGINVTFYSLFGE